MASISYVGPPTLCCLSLAGLQHVGFSYHLYNVSSYPSIVEHLSQVGLICEFADRFSTTALAKYPNIYLQKAYFIGFYPTIIDLFFCTISTIAPFSLLLLRLRYYSRPTFLYCLYFSFRRAHFVDVISNVGSRILLFFYYYC